MFKLIDVVAAAVSLYETQGYVKKNQFNYYVDDEENTVIPNATILRTEFTTEASHVTVTPAHREEAVKVVDYVNGLVFKKFSRKLSPFEESALEIANKEEISEREIGLTSCFPDMYANYKRAQVWKDREAELVRSSEFVGTKSQRSTFNNVVVEQVRELRNVDSNLVCCSVDNKHILKFFDNARKFSKGDSFNMTAYVKDQTVSDYHGGKETLVNRIKKV